jgi:hypothetical protein
MNTQINALNDQDLLAVAGGMPDPVLPIIVTWEDVHANPEEFNARWAEYKKAHSWQFTA